MAVPKWSDHSSFPLPPCGPSHLPHPLCHQCWNKRLLVDIDMRPLVRRSTTYVRPGAAVCCFDRLAQATRLMSMCSIFLFCPKNTAYTQGYPRYHLVLVTSLFFFVIQQSIAQGQKKKKSKRLIGRFGPANVSIPIHHSLLLYRESSSSVINDQNKIFFCRRRGRWDKGAH